MQDLAEVEVQHQHALEIMEAMTHPSPGPICLPLLGVQQPFMALWGTTPAIMWLQSHHVNF